MQKAQISVGKLAFKLYNKVGSTEQEQEKAKALIDAEKPESLDIYGKFVRAELIFWNRNSDSYAFMQAFEIFQKIIIDKQSPKPLIIGACFFLGRIYELGLGVDLNKSTAYAHYRLANKLNPKACVKDIARLQKAQSTEKPKVNQSTPERFKYRWISESNTTREYEFYMHEWAQEYEKCKQSLKDNKFFYPDDPDEVSLEEIDMYCVDGVIDIPFSDPPKYCDIDEYDYELDELLELLSDDDDDDLLEFFDDD